MSKIICIGSSCQDIFFPTSEGTVLETPEELTSKSKIFFELGAKYKIEKRYESLGGCAANVACGLAKLEIETSCYSCVGGDTLADWIKEELKKNSVSINLITQEKDYPSDMSAVIVDKKSADRVIFSNQIANGRLEVIPDKIKHTDWIFIGDLHGDWKKNLDRIHKTAGENNIKVASNPRQINIHDNAEKIIETIPLGDVLFLNKDEAIEIVSAMGADFSQAELDDEKFLAGKIKEKGAEIVAITDGVRGAWAAEGEEVYFAPGIKVKALDSTGAGDSFASGFLAAHIKGKNIEECLSWGIANSTSAVQFYGAIEGLLNEDKMKNVAKQVKVSHL